MGRIIKITIVGIVGLIFLAVILTNWAIEADLSCEEVRISEGATFKITESFVKCLLYFCEDKEINGVIQKVNCEEKRYGRYS